MSPRAERSRVETVTRFEPDSEGCIAVEALSFTNDRILKNPGERKPLAFRVQGLTSVRVKNASVSSQPFRELLWGLGFALVSINGLGSTSGLQQFVGVLLGVAALAVVVHIFRKRSQVVLTSEDATTTILLGIELSEAEVAELEAALHEHLGYPTAAGRAAHRGE